MIKRFSKKKRIVWAVALCIFLGACLTFGFEISLRNVAKQIALARAAVIVNNAVTASAYRSDFSTWYEKLVIVDRSSLGEIQSVRIDGAALNQLAGQIQKSVTDLIDADSQKPLTVSLSSILGTASIGISGPRFSVDCSALPSVDVSIQSRFEQAGINQTKHSLVATVHTVLRIFVAGRLAMYETETPVLLCETVIVGSVPSTYLQNDTNTPVLPLLPLKP
jgi:sporulation protein YunB